MDGVLPTQSLGIAEASESHLYFQRVQQKVWCRFRRCVAWSVLCLFSVFPATAQSDVATCPATEELIFQAAIDHPLLLDGVSEFENGLLQNADSLFRLASKRNRLSAEAFYWLARLKIDERINEPALASRFIRNAINREPENVRYIEERLHQLNSGNPFFTGSDVDRQFWAAKILAVDTTNAIAFENIGLDSMDQFYHYLGLLASNYNDVLVEMKDEASYRARSALEKTLSIAPCRRDLYDVLTKFHIDHKDFDAIRRLMVLMQKMYPKDFQTWLYSGVADYYLGDLDEAEALFDTAFRQMSREEMATFTQQTFLFTDNERELSEMDSSYVGRFWETKRARFLVDANERLLAHYARLVYSDLSFPYWRDFAADEWLVTPGEMIVRYGLPARAYSSYQYAGGNTGAIVAMNRYLQLSFQGRSFRFTDQFRNGEYFLQDDATYGGSRDLTSARSEVFRTPQSYSYEGPARFVDVPYLISAFKSESEFISDSHTSSDVLISLGIPIQFSGTDSSRVDAVVDKSNLGSLDQFFMTLGSFLVDPNGEIVADRKQTFFGLPENSIVETSGGILWTTTHKLAVAPSEYKVSVEFETVVKDVIGATASQHTVPRYFSDSLAVSDMLLAFLVEDDDALPSSQGNLFHRHGFSIVPAPWAVYSVDQPIYVYFEMYGLQKQPDGQTQIEMDIGLVPDSEDGGILGFFNRLLGGEDQAGVAVTSNFAGTSVDDAQYLIVDTSEQPPGQYQLVLRIRDLVSGLTSETFRTIYLVED